MKTEIKGVYPVVFLLVTLAVIGAGAFIYAGITTRNYIAGLLEYSDENFVRWVRSPTTIDPDTLMSDLGVTEAHARAMLSYLKSLEQ
jgi:cytochrome c2